MCLLRFKWDVIGDLLGIYPKFGEILIWDVDTILTCDLMGFI